MNENSLHQQDFPFPSLCCFPFNNTHFFVYVKKGLSASKRDFQERCYGPNQISTSGEKSCMRSRRKLRLDYKWKSCNEACKFPRHCFVKESLTGIIASAAVVLPPRRTAPPCRSITKLEKERGLLSSAF